MSSLTKDQLMLVEDVNQESTRVIDGEVPDWTPADEKRIRRRIDFHIIPIVFVLYLLCFIDRTNIGNARIQGLRKDVDVAGYKWNWVLTIFFISYCAVEVPSNILLKRVGAHYWVPFLICGFGLVSICTSFCSSFAGLMVCRFMLGVFEGGVIPGISYYLSLFYRREELSFRIGIFISGAALSGSFGGLLAAGLSAIPSWGTSALPMHAWRNIFFIEGLLTVVIGALSVFVLPNGPHDARFLSQHDRVTGTQRVAIEQNERVGEKTNKHHLRGMFSINNINCAMLTFCGNVAVQSFSLFLPTILSALGWTNLKTQFYTVPPYTVATFWTIFITWLSDRTQQRGFCMAGSLVLAIVGYTMLITVHSANAKYGATFLAICGAFPTAPIVVSWALNNASGTNARAVAAGFIFSFGYVGAIMSTWTYRTTDAPNYIQGHAIVLAFMCLGFVLSIFGALYARWENSMRDAGKRDGRLAGLDEDAANKLGYRHPKFRYMM